MTQEEFNSMLTVAIAQGIKGGTYISKYSGKEIDNLLDQVEPGSNADIDALMDGSITSLITGAETIGQYALVYRRNLKEITLAGATSIGTNAFLGCSSLFTVTIETDSVCTLAGISAFQGTPFLTDDWDEDEDGELITGSIRVPANLVDAYKTANVWRNLAIYIEAIE